MPSTTAKPKNLFTRSLRLAVTAVKKGKFKQLSRIAWRRTLRHFKTRTPLPSDAQLLGSHLEEFVKDRNMSPEEKRSFVANGIYHYIKLRKQIGDADKFHEKLFSAIYKEQAPRFLKEYVGRYETSTVTLRTGVDEMEQNLINQVREAAIFYTFKYVIARYNATNKTVISTPTDFAHFWLEKWEWDKLSPEEQATIKREQKLHVDRAFSGQFRPAGRRT